MSQRPILKYAPEKLDLAMEGIRNGMKIREAGRYFGVPRGTLQDRLHLRVPEGPRKMGPDSVLTKSEESKIVSWCIDLTKCGCPLKTDNLINTVHCIMLADGRVNPFKNERPGKKWLRSFFKRNPSLSIRTPEEISKGRAVVTEEFIGKWFNDLKDYLTSQNALDLLDDPQRIFNGDETSFMICPKTGKVIAPRGYKNVYQIVKGNQKETITTLAFLSANGDILPPCFVFPYIRPPKDVMNSIPDDWLLGKSDSGWMKADIFSDYIPKGLNEWLKHKQIKKPVLVFVDGHKSHLTMKLSQFCFDNNIILYALPPNTTHIMQPADVSVFKPLKSERKQTIHNWSCQPENANKCLTKVTFCPLLKKILEKENLKHTIKNGFRRCGLYPFNPDAVDYTKCVQNNSEKLKHRKNFKSPIKSLRKRDFDTASEVVAQVNKELSERGVDVATVLEVIGSAKNTHGLNDSVESQESPDAAIDGSNDFPIIEDTEIKNTANSTLFMETENDLSKYSLPLLGDSTLSNNLGDDDIEMGIFEVDEDATLIRIDSSSNVVALKNRNFSHHKAVSDTLIVSQNVSPVLTDYLKIPSPIKKSSTPRVLNRIGAISSKEWRNFEKQKEEEKERKKAEIQDRKLQREKLKK